MTWIRITHFIYFFFLLIVHHSRSYILLILHGVSVCDFLFLYAHSLCSVYFCVGPFVAIRRWQHNACKHIRHTLTPKGSWWSECTEMEFVIWYNLRIVENAYSIVYSTIIQCMSCSNISSLIRIHLVLFLFLSLSPVSSILVFSLWVPCEHQHLKLIA